MKYLATISKLLLSTLLLFTVTSISSFGQTILDEGLQDGSLPTGWTQTDVTFNTTSSGGYAYFTSVSAVLESPAIDLTSYSEANLSFSVAKYGSGDNGPITVEISTDGGTTWDAQTFDSPVPTSSTYMDTTAALDASVVGQSDVRIRFSRPNSPSQKRLRDVLITGPDGVSVTEVATLADLVAGSTDGTLYELTGEAIVTYYAGGWRNQFYIQDGTEAILVDDADGTITADLEAGVGITGLTGTLSEYNGTLQFIPSEDPTSITSGNVVPTESVTLNELTADDQSKLVTVTGVTFPGVAADSAFEASTDYGIDDGSLTEGTFNFRTNFSDADYIGANIPTESFTLTGIISQYNGTPQITARNGADMGLTIETGPEQVSDLAGVVAGTVGADYEITGEVIVTYYAGGSRNQFYIQDGSEAILIDDSEGTITADLEVGDGITGLTGTLGEYNGTLQFIPAENPTEITSGNEVPVVEKSLNELTGDDQSLLVKVSGVTFEGVGADSAFESSTNYDIVDGSLTEETFTFRTSFSGADYIGETIPTDTITIVGIIAQFYGTPQITARSSSDFFVPLPEVAAPEISPEDGYISDVNVEVTITAEAGTDVYYTLDGSTPDSTSSAYTEPFTLTETTEVKAIAYLDTVSSPVSSASYEFAIEVATIAEAKAGEAGAIYKITGEVYLHNQYSFRNKKYLTDATAGLLIDDNSGVIETEYNRFDGITGLTGRISPYYAQTQFVPVADPGPATSTDNTIYPEPMTLAELDSADQDKWVYVQDVQFRESGTFDGGNNYEITDPSLGQGETGIFRTDNYDAEFIGDPLPNSAVNVAGYVLSFGSGESMVIQISASDSSDIVDADAISSFGLEGPADNDTVFVTGEWSDEITISWEQAESEADVSYTWLATTPDLLFSVPLLAETSDSEGSETTLTGTKADLMDLLEDFEIPEGESLTLKWTIAATSGDTLRYADEVRTLTLHRGIITSNEEHASTPDKFVLDQNYPNPFNPSTKIQYALPENANVQLTVYNMLGQRVATLLNNQLQRAGTHSVNFDGSNLSSGVYFYRLEAGSFSQVKKMLLLK